MRFRFGDDRIRIRCWRHGRFGDTAGSETLTDVGWAVRTATAADAAAIVDVRIAAWQTAYRGIMPESILDAMRAERPDQLRRMRERLRNPSAYDVLVGHNDNDDDNGRLLGMCVVGPGRDAEELPGFGELLAINLHPDAWGTGLGAAMLRAAEERLRSDGWAHAYLWVVDGNARARRFYQRHGWNADGAVKTDDRFGTGATEVRYRRRLG